MATLRVNSTNTIINVKIGDVLEAPTDKHSKATYTLFKIANRSIEIKYNTVFDARSFGGSIIENEGTFSISVEN